jgi:hypothetical protein
MGVLKRIGSKVMSTVRTVDSYGQKITFTYKRNSMFKTHLGGWATILLIVGMLSYLIFLFNVLIQRSTINVTTNTEIKDLANYPEFHNIGKSGFFLAFGFRLRNYGILDREEYISLSVQEITYESIGVGSWNTILRDLPLKAWGNDFRIDNKKRVESYNFDKYVCVDSSDYSIGGNWYSDKSKFISIKIKPWDNSTFSGTWETIGNIDSFIENEEFDLVMIDKYFDAESYDESVKQYITQDFKYSGISTFSKYVYISIKENELQLMDSVFQYGDHTKKTFYSISKERIDDSIFAGSYFDVTIQMDSQKLIHERTVFSFFDMVAQLGGVYGVIAGILLYALGYYSEKMMYFSILRRLYHTECKANKVLDDVGNNNNSTSPSRKVIDKKQIQPKTQRIFGNSPKSKEADSKNQWNLSKEVICHNY